MCKHSVVTTNLRPRPKLAKLIFTLALCCWPADMALDSLGLVVSSTIFSIGRYSMYMNATKRAIEAYVYRTATQEAFNDLDRRKFL